MSYPCVKMVDLTWKLYGLDFNAQMLPIATGWAGADGGPGSVDEYTPESELTKVVAAVAALNLTEDV